MIFLVLDDLGRVATLLCNFFFSHGLLEYAPGGREPHGALIQVLLIYWVKACKGSVTA